MPIADKPLTTSSTMALEPPGQGYTLIWCPRFPGFGARITANGARSWIVETEVNGKTVRRTIGRVEGRGSIGADEARRLARERVAELVTGKDRLAERRAADKQRLTFGDALREYVSGKRRAKDGLPLKQRTIDDYLEMIEPEAPGKHRAGPLAPLATRRLVTLTGDGLRRRYAVLVRRRGQRQADYAMQVLRAVVNWHGAAIADNPFTAAGKHRIQPRPSTPRPSVIPADKLTLWWRAAEAIDTAESACLRLMLLTGMRPSEACAWTRAGDALVLTDTKNRTDHVVFMSKQTAAIVDAWPEAVGDLRPALKAINAAAGTPHVTPKVLRKTTASLAESLVSIAVAKRVINHGGGGDVTKANYLSADDRRVAAAMQEIADFITGVSTA